MPLQRVEVTLDTTPVSRNRVRLYWIGAKLERKDPVLTPTGQYNRYGVPMMEKSGEVSSPVMLLIKDKVHTMPELGGYIDVFEHLVPLFMDAARVYDSTGRAYEGFTTDPAHAQLVVKAVADGKPIPTRAQDFAGLSTPQSLTLEELEAELERRKASESAIASTSDDDEEGDDSKSTSSRKTRKTSTKE